MDGELERMSLERLKYFWTTFFLEPILIKKGEGLLRGGGGGGGRVNLRKT
jgi:hypothetical protein